MKVMVTGASGFIGRSLVSMLKNNDVEIVAVVRSETLGSQDACASLIGQIDGNTDWSGSLIGVDVVVHVAARAHVLRESVADPEKAFLDTNYHGTVWLAEEAVKAGVKRLIFLSSVAVYGVDQCDGLLDESSPTNPVSFYGKTKLAAEEFLKDFASRTGLQIVIVRSPLVYGSDAPGNFGLLLGLVNKSIPLPFKLADNKRSFIAKENLLDFIQLCIDDERAVNQTFLISDGFDLSTNELLELLAKGMGRRLFIFPFPLFILKILAVIAGRTKTFHQLCGSLCIDISKAKNQLSWSPKVSPQVAVAIAAKEYVRNLQSN